jgi:hypothetical protein
MPSQTQTLSLDFTNDSAVKRMQQTTNDICDVTGSDSTECQDLQRIARNMSSANKCNKSWNSDVCGVVSDVIAQPPFNVNLAGMCSAGTLGTNSGFCAPERSAATAGLASRTITVPDVRRMLATAGATPRRQMGADGGDEGACPNVEGVISCVLLVGLTVIEVVLILFVIIFLILTLIRFLFSGMGSGPSLSGLLGRLDIFCSAGASSSSALSAGVGDPLRSFSARFPTPAAM